MMGDRRRSDWRRAAYARRRGDELILRDVLALDRTVLANERTLLAYVRSALALLVAGVTLIHFFDMALARILGYAIVPLAPLIMIYGTWRFMQVRGHLTHAAGGAADPTIPEPERSRHAD